MPTSRQNLRRLVLLAAVQVVGLVCGVIGVRWTSTVIPPELLGLYGLLLSAVQCALVVTHQGFVKHVQSTWTPTQAAQPYFGRIGRALAAPTWWLIAGLLVVFAVLHFTGNVPLHPALFLWLVVANLGVATSVALQSALVAEDRLWSNLGVNAVNSVTRSFGPPLLVMLLGASLSAVSSAFLFHVIAGVLVPLWLLRSAWRRPSTAPAPDDDLPRLVKTFAAIGFGGWIAGAAPRWIAAAALDAEETGYFVLAGNLSLIVPAAIGAVLLGHSFPRLFAQARAGASAAESQRSTHRTLLVLLLVSQAGLIALAWLAPWLIGPVIAARYEPATTWLLATGGAALATTSAQFYHNLLLSQNRERACLWVSALSLVLRLGIMLFGALDSPHIFRLCLIVMPWVTVLAEGVLTHWLLHRSEPAR